MALVFDDIKKSKVQTTEGEPADEAAQPVKIRMENSNVAEIEKRKARAARFEVPLNNPEDKKALRVWYCWGCCCREEDVQRAYLFPVSSLKGRIGCTARFNVPLVTTEQLRLKSRAERFRDQLSNAPLAKAAVKSKPSTAAAAEFEAKRKARAERFKVAL